MKTTHIAFALAVLFAGANGAYAQQQPAAQGPLVQQVSPVQQNYDALIRQADPNRELLVSDHPVTKAPLMSFSSKLVADLQKGGTIEWWTFDNNPPSGKVYMGDLHFTQNNRRR